MNPPRDRLESLWDRGWLCGAAVGLGAVPARACGSRTPRRVCESVESNIGFSLGTPRTQAFEGCGAFIPAEQRRRLAIPAETRRATSCHATEEQHAEVNGIVCACLWYSPYTSRLSKSAQLSSRNRGAKEARQLSARRVRTRSVCSLMYVS